MTSTTLIRCAAILLAGIPFGSVLAADPAEPSKAITYADLNLNSSAGIAALYQRIERAASEVCQAPQGTKQLKIEQEVRACRANSVDRAIVQVKLPALSALHVARTGRKVDTAQYADRR